MFSEKAITVLKIRSRLLQAVRSWLSDRGYVEVQGPVIIPAIEDLPCSFEVEYFGKKAYLTQGLHPYANAFASHLGKVFTIAPAFRAEKLRTRRHLAEYWRIQVTEQGRFEKVISVQEELVAHVCSVLSEEAMEVLEFLNRPVDDLNKVRVPFPRLTYDEVISLLQRDGFKVWWGQNIDWEMEQHLSLQFKQPFFITSYPLNAETFFFKPDSEKPELTLSVDMLAPEGYGEMSSGAEMITDKEMMLEKLNEANVVSDSQRWFMSFNECHSSPLSGFAMGLERLTQWICKLVDIKEAAAFPRLYDSYFP